MPQVPPGGAEKCGWWWEGLEHHAVTQFRISGGKWMDGWIYREKNAYTSIPIAYLCSHPSKYISRQLPIMTGLPTESLLNLLLVYYQSTIACSRKERICPLLPIVYIWNCLVVRKERYLPWGMWSWTPPGLPQPWRCWQQWHTESSHLFSTPQQCSSRSPLWLYPKNSSKRVCINFHWVLES